MDYFVFVIDRFVSIQFTLLRKGKRLNPLIGLLLPCGRLWKAAVAEMADDGLHSNRLGTVRAPHFTLSQLPLLNRFLVFFEEDRHRECDNKNQCAIDPPEEEAMAFGSCDIGRNQAKKHGEQKQ